MTPIYVICTGPNYFPKHVARFERQLKDHTSIDFKVHCYTTYDRSMFDSSIEVIPIEHERAMRQWYKVDLFEKAPVGEVVFMSDLDWTFVGDVTDILSQPVSKNELIAPYRWWTRWKGRGFTINGGLYKFIGGDHQYIPQQFYTDPKYWMQRYIIDLQIAHPPCNGEQNFVDETIRANQGVLKYFEPQHAFARQPVDREHAVEYNDLYTRHFNKEWCWMGEFHPDVRMIHSILDN